MLLLLCLILQSEREKKTLWGIIVPVTQSECCLKVLTLFLIQQKMYIRWMSNIYTTCVTDAVSYVSFPYVDEYFLQTFDI